jgi:nitroreductase
MNEVLKNMETRRSCRAYRPDALPEETLGAILEAGLWAPSGMGRQSVTLVAVTDPGTRETLRRMNAAVLGSPAADPFYGAPAVVVALADPAVPTCVEDGSLAIGSMLLAASSLGVGSCWIHRAREEFGSAEGRALLKKWGLPENLRGVGHCILGLPAAPAGAGAPRKTGRIVRI